MLVKRATAKLLAAGIEHIEIHKGLYGFTPYDSRLTRQASITYNTAGEAVHAVLDGMRPTVQGWHAPERRRCNDCGEEWVDPGR